MEADHDQVRLEVGGSETTFSPEEARSFAYYLARAYYRANVVKEAKS